MYLKDFQNKNKIALVTGAGKGIGKAAALALAESGADIIAISRTASDLAQLQKKINRLNKRCMTFQCDILDYDHIKKVFSKISKTSRTVDMNRSISIIFSSDQLPPLSITWGKTWIPIDTGFNNASVIV